VAHDFARVDSEQIGSLEILFEMDQIPRLPTSGGYALALWCCMGLVICGFVAYDPVKFFQFLNWRRRPLPRIIEKPFVQAFYRITAIAIFLWILRLLVQVLNFSTTH
jgi:hypothetical protein